MPKQQLHFIRNAIAVGVLSRDESEPGGKILRLALTLELLSKGPQSFAKWIVRKFVKVFRWMIQLRRQMTRRAAIQVRGKILTVIFEEGRFVGWSCACRKSQQAAANNDQQADASKRNTHANSNHIRNSFEVSRIRFIRAGR